MLQFVSLLIKVGIISTFERNDLFVKRIIKLSIFILIITIISSITFVAVAASNPTLMTTGIVNLRSSPAIESDNTIGTLNQGVAVEVLVHDPAGWSRVRALGTTGYIRSDLLTIASGSGSVTFRTVAGVNVRSAASTESNVLTTIYTGLTVEVLEHDPTGWSRVRFEGVTGFIRSDFLSITAQSELGAQNVSGAASVSQTASATQAPAASAAQPSASTAESVSSGVLRTTGTVNLRVGPSTDHQILRTLAAGTAVDVLGTLGEWSRVSFGESTGYIRSDLLSENAPISASQVELLEWSEVRRIMRTGVPIRVYDIGTGLSFYIQAFSIGDHADVEPITAADTEIKLRTRGGTWSWAARPVWVTVEGRTIAAALAGMPHDVSTIPDNGVNGHFCLHFRGSVTTSNSQWYRNSLRDAVAAAWEAAN